MQPVHARTQLKKILRIIFGPIRMDFTKAGLTQKEQDYPEDINQPFVPKICFSISLNIESFCFIIYIRFHMLEPKTNYQLFRLIIGPKTNY